MKEIAPGVFIETNYALVTVGAILTSKGWVCIDTPPYPPRCAFLAGGVAVT